MCNFKFFVFRKYAFVIISFKTLEIISRILELVEADLPIFAVYQNGKSKVPIAYHYHYFVYDHEDSTHSVE
jgi:hypothetical protein